MRWVWLFGAMLLLGVPLATAQFALPDTLLWEPVGELQQGTWLAFDGDTLYAGLHPVTGQEHLSRVVVLDPKADKWGATRLDATVRDMAYMPNGTIYVYGVSTLARSSGSLDGFSDVHFEVRFMLPIETPEGALLVGVNDAPFVATRSTDDGLTWIDHGGPQVALSGMSPVDLLVLPPTSGRLNHRIVAVGYGGILFSDDDGRIWHPSSVYAEGPAFTAWAGVRIASGPYDGGYGGELLAVIESNGGSSLMARSSDGVAWEAVASFPGQARLNSDLLAMPDGTVYLYEGIGDNGDRDGRTLWRTANGGETWQAVGPVWREWSAVPTDLAIGPDGRLWASATGARGGGKRGGVFRTVEPVYVASGGGPEAAPLTLAVRPNPSRQRVTLELAGPPSEPRQLVVVDSVGREVARTELAADSSWRLDVSGWAPGVYHARAGDGVEAVAFTVVR
ncbi:MAG: hypothetical protein Rubg2KO_13660 [Rubricoccaceae bacterium]